MISKIGNNLPKKILLYGKFDACWFKLKKSYQQTIVTIKSKKGKTIYIK